MRVLRERHKKYFFEFNTISFDETPNIEAINDATASCTTGGVENSVNNAAREVVIGRLNIRAFNPGIMRNIVVIYIEALTEGTTQYEHKFVFKVGKGRITSISQGLSHDGLGHSSTIQIPV